MSKEIDNIKLEASIEKAIDAMEPSTDITDEQLQDCLLYTSPSPRDCS